jgi:23S rRNA (cytidine1920-2'-O)/16S rRNA (cytidine1409-2'-O)-methyltransferase
MDLHQGLQSKSYGGCSVAKIAYTTRMRKRLDELLVEKGLVATRSRARDAIVRGLVRVDGDVVTKAGAGILDGARLTVAPEAGTNYVSRGALKLKAALDHFGFEAMGRVALDAGASTGGFTEVLLERGAAKVYAVDVGHGQLHPRISAQDGVVPLEGQDVRLLDSGLVREPVTALVADVSFISLTKVLPGLMALTAKDAWLVALVKPQFEVGPAAVGKGGVVKDEAARKSAIDAIERLIADTPSWTVAGVIPSPIEGGSGNVEFLIGARQNG